MDETTRLHNPKRLIPLNQSPQLTKDSDHFECARVTSSYVNVSALDVNNICCLKLWVGTDIAF